MNPDQSVAPVIVVVEQTYGTAAYEDFNARRAVSVIKK